MIRAALFDLDGTLVDTEQQTMSSIAAVLQRRGIVAAPYPPEEACGRSWEHIANTMRARYPLRDSTQVISQELLEIWNEQVTREAKLIPGAREAITEAHRAGVALAVVSSSPRSVIDAMLRLIGVSALISVRIGSDGVTKYKPDPEGYLMAANVLSVRPEECVVFEDSSSGVKAARAAGMHIVAILGASHEREVVRAQVETTIRDYTDLPPQFFHAIIQGESLKKLLTGSAI
jgi:HAD superfamily hydrolase (TIGR01509 family)